MEVKIISDEGLKHFPKNKRKYFEGTNVYSPRHKVMAFCKDISTKKKLAYFVYSNWGYGRFRIYGRSGAKTKYHNKPVCLAEITIIPKDNYEGYEFEFEHPVNKKTGYTINRLKRFWFWGEFKND